MSGRGAGGEDFEGLVRRVIGEVIGEHEREARERRAERRSRRRRAARRVLVRAALAVGAFAAVLAVTRALNPRAPWGAVLAQAALTSAFALSTGAGELRHRRGTDGHRDDGPTGR